MNGESRAMGWHTGWVQSAATFPTVLAALTLAAVTACSGTSASTTDDSTAPSEAAPHTHAPGETEVSMLVGDGTRRSEVGYRLSHVHLPRQANRIGEVRFTIQDHEGAPIRDYVPVQTKDLHLYVVREDLSVFRHLHPTMDSDGVWVAPLTLPRGGQYRVITEFAALDAGGMGDLVMLGALAPAVKDADSGETTAVPVKDIDHLVTVEVEGNLVAGDTGVMTLVIGDDAGRPVQLGDYLGAGAHVTGFHLDTGSVAHLHPLGPPQVTEDGTRLSFHTEFAESGAYRTFVQVRVGGLLETVPITLDVA